MKKFRFLLLDAGPVIKLFELGIWDEFIKRCDVTITRTVAEDEVVFAGSDFEKEFIDYGLHTYEKQGLITIVDVELAVVRKFYEAFTERYKQIIHPGEKETLALLCDSDSNWLLCAADGAVFRVLGLLGKSEQGISLEEVLERIGLARRLENQFTKRFRQRYTSLGAVDAIQDAGLSE